MSSLFKPADQMMCLPRQVSQPASRSAGQSFGEPASKPNGTNDSIVFIAHLFRQPSPKLRAPLSVSTEACQIYFPLLLISRKLCLPRRQQFASNSNREQCVWPELVKLTPMLPGCIICKGWYKLYRRPTSLCHRLAEVIHSAN